MRAIVRWNRAGTLIVLVILTILFTIASWIFQNTDVLIAVRSFQFASAAAVVWSYKTAMAKVWNPSFGSPEDLLTFAIVLGYAAMGINALWLLLWRGALEPPWMVDAAINGYLVLISSWAATIYSAAPGAKQGFVRNESKYVLTLVLVLTVFMTVLGLKATSTFMAIEGFLRPYMAEDPNKVMTPNQLHINPRTGGR